MIPEWMYVEWNGEGWRTHPSVDPVHGFPVTPWPPSEANGWERTP